MGAPLDAINMIPSAGLVQIFFAAGLFELTAYNRQWTEGRDIPGDYGYDPLAFTKRPGGWESEELTKIRMMEIKNGRVALNHSFCKRHQWVEMIRCCPRSRHVFTWMKVKFSAR